MPTYSLIESRARVVPLSTDQAEELQRLGRALASDRQFWGDSEPNANRSVLDCRPDKRGFRVVVHNCIGTIGIGELVLNVRPKIPRDHFLYLMRLANRLPRTETPRALAGESEALWPLVVGWFLSAAEELVVRQLARGYCEVTRELPFLRGKIDLSRSTVNWYASGSASTVCTYEEFEVDTPLNRMVKHAAVVAAESPLLTPDLRRRAVGIIDHMGEVGAVRASDSASAEISRVTAYYADVLPLAREVVARTGRFPGLGRQVAWTFLIRTPELVQDAVRRLLIKSSKPELQPDPRGGKLRLGSTAVTVNPDLVFSGADAIGDVKYKLEARRSNGSSPGWRRSDLYEVVSFAAAYKVPKALVLGFNRRGLPEPPAVQVGDISVAHFGWSVHRGSEPEASAAAVVLAVRSFLEA